MSFLLVAINAKYIHSNLAVYSLRAYASAKGYRTELLEFTINQESEIILRKIYEKRPKVLFFSCYIWNVSFVMDIISDIAKVLPETDIWVGGPEVSFDAREVLQKNPFIKGVLRGEGERIFANVLAAYEEGKPFTEVKGLTFRQEENVEKDDGIRNEIIPNGIVKDGMIENNIIQNPDEEIMDMSDIPFPYNASAGMELKAFDNRIIYYESSRGCPFSCSYCLSSIDKKLRFRNLSLVYEELAFFLKARVHQVKFVDRTFNCKASHSLAIWEYINEHDNGVTNFHFEIAADLLTEAELSVIRKMRPGLIQLEIGVQSTNQRTIQAIRRVMNLEKVRKAVDKVRSFGNVNQHLDLIAGLPYEDFNSFRNSFAQVYAMHPEQLQLGFLKVLKGSFMYEHIEEYEGRYRSRQPYEILSTKWLSFSEVLSLKLVEEMVEVYYNSLQFVNVLNEVENHMQHMFDFYLELGQYYLENDLLLVSHSRLARYHHLLDFLGRKAETWSDEGIDPKAVKNAAVIDFYTRENAKSRPDFAADLSAYKDLIHNFYKREEENRRFLTAYQGYDYKQLMRMTHIEIFESPRGREVLLFDYRNRNPLNGAAGVIDISNFFSK